MKHPVKSVNPFLVLLWPITGAAAAAIYLDVPSVLRTLRTNHDTVAPVVVPLFVLMVISIAAGASSVTGFVLCYFLKRSGAISTFVNLALWVGILSFAFTAPGKALLTSQHEPVASLPPSPVPACYEKPPSGGQDLKTWEFQCAGANSSQKARD